MFCKYGAYFWGALDFVCGLRDILLRHWVHVCLCVFSTIVRMVLVLDFRAIMEGPCGFCHRLIFRIYLLYVVVSVVFGGQQSRQLMDYVSKPISYYTEHILKFNLKFLHGLLLKAEEITQNQKEI